MHKIHFQPDWLLHSLLILMLLTCADARADKDETDQTTSLKPFTTEFVLRKRGFNIAQIRYQLIQQDAQYVFSANAKPKGVAALVSNTPINEESIVDWRNNQLQPRQYQRLYSGKPDAKIQDMQISYNQQLGTASVILGDSEFDIAIENGLWDNCSLQVALMHDLRQGLKNLDYRVIDDGELKQQHYSVEAIETINTAVGQHQALKVVYNHGSRQTLLWFDTDKGFVPIKIQQYKKDKLDSEMLLQSITVDEVTL
ncbi:MAG: DUF3108 domain-containing protein [Gammaproteobacteria bacterium]|nr:DUF3108 domain-containing protein [Gammaproteobacteria bacterium]